MNEHTVKGYLGSVLHCMDDHHSFPGNWAAWKWDKMSDQNGTSIPASALFLWRLSNPAIFTSLIIHNYLLSVPLLVMYHIIIINYYIWYYYLLLWVFIYDSIITLLLPTHYCISYILYLPSVPHRDDQAGSAHTVKVQGHCWLSSSYQGGRVCSTVLIGVGTSDQA